MMMIANRFAYTIFLTLFPSGQDEKVAALLLKTGETKPASKPNRKNTV